MSDVIGSAEIEIRATRKKLKQDTDAAEREIKQATKAIENAYGDAGKGAAREMNISQRQMVADARRTADALGARYRELGTDIGRSMMGASRAAQLAFAGIVGYSLKAASEAEDIGDAFAFTFSAMGPQSEAAAAKIADDFKRTSTQVKGNLTTLYQVITGFGIDSATAFAMSSQITSRALDLASQKGISDARAFQAVLGGITGETEPLKNLGVVITEAAVKSELLRMGFKGGAETATEAQKATARLNIILAKTASAQGDVARTSDSAANKAKELQTAFQNAAVELGTQLLPTFVKVAGAATDVLKSFNDMPAGLQVASLAVLGFIAAGGPIAGLLANLGKVIKLARDTRLAMMGLTGANVAAGASGAAGAGVAGAGALLGAPGVVGVAGAVALGIGSAKQSDYRKTTAAVADATDDALAAAINYARANVAILNREGSVTTGASQRRSGFMSDLYALQVEQQRRDRAARVSGGGTVDTSVVGGFQLPSGGGGGAGGRSGTRPNTTSFAGKTINITAETVEFGKEPLSAPAAQIDQNPAGFMASGDGPLGDLLASLADQREGAKEEFRAMFSGGLMAALQDGGKGFEDWIRQGAERGLENALNNLADVIFELFSQAIPSSGGGGGGGFWASAAKAVGSIFGFGGARAYGGPVMGGKSYLVGEHGPEILRAPGNGMIIPTGGFTKGAGAAERPIVIKVEANDYFDARVDGRAKVVAGRITARASGAIYARATSDAARNAPVAVGIAQAQRG